MSKSERRWIEQQFLKSNVKIENQERRLMWLLSSGALMSMKSFPGGYNKLLATYNK